ncbi:MAG: 50S ribosomal protein L22 [Alphaproteobacteria bacterium]|nr:50S ribosomal protein L22 [Alphaproteobacteria bacterium]
MGQKANERRVRDNEAMAMAKHLRGSAQKLNLVAQTIRGKDAGKALIDLEFNNRRFSQDVRKVLQSAISNAENNHGLDVDRLYVAEAFVGKDIMMKRFRARARGRAARILKPFSRITIVVREREDANAPKKATKKPPVDVTKSSAPKKAEDKKKETKAATKKTAKKAAKKAPAAKKTTKKTATKKAAKKSAKKDK